MSDIDFETETAEDTPLIRQLRAQLKEKAKEAKTGREASVELDRLRREDAIRKAQITDLNDRQMKTLTRELEGQEPTAENVRTIAIELGWATQDPADLERDEEISTQQRIANANQGGGMPPNYSTITPDIAAEWDVNKLLRFQKKYPEEYEELKRGNEVPGVVF